MSEVDPVGAGDGPGTVETPGSVVEVRTSASASLIPTIRAVASDLAARADFDLDAISDLRMAVDEACATLVDVAAPGSALRCTFDVREELIRVHAEVDTGDAATPVSTDTFGWRVLQTLADQVELEANGSGIVGIRLHKRADAAPR
ncbi:ATP-binding protein [Pseudonocardia sp. RS11V-5]|uniref:ATP-binding protein n=1 Tax=Pseudonocardia terrae TaxID=2905831 RepID=UPI001E54E083|nr:ATP-binding protein [Pseudonocardia terrae]MCE3556153.1 ATP-binding protein [Pseudonocardia terrae]